MAEKTYSIEYQGQSVIIKGSFVAKLPDGRIAVQSRGSQGYFKTTVENLAKWRLFSLRTQETEEGDANS